MAQFPPNDSPSTNTDASARKSRSVLAALARFAGWLIAFLPCYWSLLPFIRELPPTWGNLASLTVLAVHCRKQLNMLDTYDGKRDSTEQLPVLSAAMLGIICNVIAAIAQAFLG